jgi:hypothetical protein
LKHKNTDRGEKERERRERDREISGWRCSERHYMYHEETSIKFCYEDSNECPLFLLAKVGWKRGKILATEAR